MAGNISPEALLALSREIAALSRCGIPLEQGLAAGGDLPGKTLQLAAELRKDLQQGQDLAVAVGRREEFPPLFRAVVESGLRAGRLPAAMERLADALRRVAELRRHLRQAMVYPAVVVAVAYVAFCLSVAYVLPVFSEVRADLSDGRPLPLVGWLRATGLRWCWLPPLLAAAAWWRLRGSDRFAWLGSPLQRLRQAGRMAVFAELLSLLVEQDQPLDEAVCLAAKSTGDPALAAQGEQLGAMLRQGRGGPTPDGFPPLLGWIVLSSTRQPRLVSTLERAALQYRRRAEELAAWCHLYVPIALTAAVGGSATLAYGLSLVLPWSDLLHRMIESI